MLGGMAGSGQEGSTDHQESLFMCWCAIRAVYQFGTALVEGYEIWSE